MLSGITFGYINGIITMLSLISGMYVTHVTKIGIIGAILAMVISDPLLDAYAIYIAQKSNTPDVSPSVAIKAFLTQIGIQAMFLTIIVVSPTVKQGLYASYVTGLIGTCLYGYYKELSLIDTVKNIISIAALVCLTIIIDSAVYKRFK
jgi:hypothetical protein